MIKVICGPQGCGKTKTLIDSCNQTAEKAKGNVVYITDNNNNTMQVSFKVKYINVLEFNITSKELLKGFVGGLIAGNADIEYIYIDRSRRISNLLLEEMVDFYKTLEEYEKMHDVSFVLTASCELNNIPVFLKKYA